MKLWNNSKPASPVASTIASNGSILLVEDEPLVRAMTGAVLTAMGWSVINVSSGEDAVQMLQHMRERDMEVDLVILDLILPCGISGLDTVRLLRDVQPGVRIMACSGFFGEEADKYCNDMGFNAMLAKPFTTEDLAQAVYQCIHSMEKTSSNVMATA